MTMSPSPSPLLPPPSPAPVLSSAHQVLDHPGELPDAGSWPWCQSCLPHIQLLLGQRVPSTPATIAGSAPWAFTSPFPDYICVPALIHRSQLALFAPPPVSASTPADIDSSPQQPPASVNVSTPRKTRGVKIACTNCRAANKKCDEGRPCGRCLKHGLEDSCVSAERKQRQRRTQVRQTTTAAASITVSATQRDVDDAMTPATDGSSPVLPSPSLHIAATTPGGTLTPYVNDSPEMADGVSCSSQSSPVMDSLPDDDSQFHYDHQMGSGAASATMQLDVNVEASNTYSIFANFWQGSPFALSDSALTTDQQQYTGVWQTGYGPGVSVNYAPAQSQPPPAQASSHSHFQSGLGEHGQGHAQGMSPGEHGHSYAGAYGHLSGQQQQQRQQHY